MIEVQEALKNSGKLEFSRKEIWVSGRISFRGPEGEYRLINERNEIIELLCSLSLENFQNLPWKIRRVTRARYKYNPGSSDGMRASTNREVAPNQYTYLSLYSIPLGAIIKLEISNLTIDDEFISMPFFIDNHLEPDRNEMIEGLAKIKEEIQIRNENL